VSEGWTQPLCGTCWLAYDLGFAAATGEPMHIASCVMDDELVACAVCGRPTDLGIYIRLSPEIVSEIREARDG
jgi:hypothetical protein